MISQLMLYVCNSLYLYNVWWEIEEIPQVWYSDVTSTRATYIYISIMDQTNSPKPKVTSHSLFYNDFNFSKLSKRCNFITTSFNNNSESLRFIFLVLNKFLNPTFSIWVTHCQHLAGTIIRTTHHVKIINLSETLQKHVGQKKFKKVKMATKPKTVYVI